MLNHVLANVVPMTSPRLANSMNPKTGRLRSFVQMLCLRLKSWILDRIVLVRSFALSIGANLSNREWLPRARLRCAAILSLVRSI